MTLEQLLAAHPWPAESATEPRLEWLWHFDVPLARERVWPLIADTSRLNRALGLPEMRFEDRDGVRHGTTVMGAREHAWVEHPWNWVAGEWMEMLRVYERGWMKVLYGVFLLTPVEAAKTRVSVYFGAVPASRAGRVVLQLGFPPLEKAFARAFAESSRQPELQAAVRPAFVLPGPPLLPPEAEARLTEASRQLIERGADPALVRRLLDHVRSGDEEDLYRIQLRERARAWGVDETELLKIALHATRLGVLEISWDVICPHCRGVTTEHDALGALKAKGSCAVCEVDFGTDGPDAVEITFHVHPAIRAVAHRTYCSAEPATKQHIRVQRDVPPGRTVVVTPRLEPGAWRLRLHGSEVRGLLDVLPGRERAVAWKASAPSRAHAGTELTLELINDTPRPQRFIVEETTWSDHALRPRQLLSLQEYRDLFTEDYLGADVQLAIGEQTILFTDIVGSTALYASRGDPAAFMEVKRHFDEVFPLVAKHRGAVVKTIGDAVMAAFNEPLDAVKAAVAIHACFHAGRADTQTRLRISLNTGPCIAVRLNTGVDYFGHTVNIAAKLQALADAGQIALSESVFSAHGVREWLAGRALESLTWESKAVPHPVPVKRLSCFEDTQLAAPSGRQ